MRIIKSEYGTKLWLSKNDTYGWSHKSGAAWPCSFLSDKSLFAEFDAGGDLIDLTINNGRGDQDCPSDELNAITEDMGV